MTNQAYSISLNSVSVATNVVNSTTIEFRDFQNGMVFVPSGSAITSLTWLTALNKDGPYLAAFSANGSAIVQTVAAGQAHPIPLDLRGSRFLRIVGNVAGEVSVTLKD
jgi:hypothetical protein